MSVAGFLRRWHRRLALVVGIQLLLWTASGLVFTLRPIEEIRGEHLLLPESPPPAALLPAEAAPLEILAAGGSLQGEWRLAWRRGRWLWIPGDGGPPRDARSGRLLPPLERSEAEALARSRIRGAGAVSSSTLLEASPARGEYRGGAVPAWRVELEGPEGARVYLDAWTGEVRSVRTDGWRLFDFFWGLHILDWRDREDFHHPLLIAAVILGVLSSLTGLGLGLWILRGSLAARRRRRRRT